MDRRGPQYTLQFTDLDTQIQASLHRYRHHYTDTGLIETEIQASQEHRYRLRRSKGKGAHLIDTQIQVLQIHRTVLSNSPHRYTHIHASKKYRYRPHRYTYTGLIEIQIQASQVHRYRPHRNTVTGLIEITGLTGTQIQA